MDLLALDIHNAIMHKKFSGVWSAWFNLGGEFEFAPERVSTGPSAVYCFAVGKDLLLYGNTLSGQEWSGWNRFALNVYFYEKSSCTILTDNRLCC